MYLLGGKIMALFTFYKVNCKFNWAIDDDDWNTYSFGSLKGATDWISKNSKDIDWYSIEGLEAHPCNEDDIGGQLYYGVIYYTFVDNISNSSYVA